MQTFLMTQTLSEKLAIGAEVAIMGIAIVFFVLAILWGVLEVFRVIFYDIPRKREEKRKAEQAAPQTPVEEEQTVLPEQSTQDEGEILAAITAAIALATEKQPGSFRVVSFRRTGRTPRR